MCWHHNYFHMYIYARVCTILLPLTMMSEDSPVSEPVELYQCADIIVGLANMCAPRDVQFGVEETDGAYDFIYKSQRQRTALHTACSHDSLHSVGEKEHALYHDHQN